MNTWFKTILASTLDRIGLLAALRSMRASSHGIVLTFHRVLKDAETSRCYDSHLVMSESVFEGLLGLLRTEFEVVPLDQLVRHPAGHSRQQRVAITFDDGWEDTYSVAFPLLLRYEIPATVFVCSGLLNENLPCPMLPEERFARIWERCSTTGQLPLLLEDLRKWGVAAAPAPQRREWSTRLKQMSLHTRLLLFTHLEDTYQPLQPRTRQLMNWDEARIMARNNMTIGSHTVGHCTLSSEQDATVFDELCRSRAEILKQVGVDAQLLAYPNGGYNSRVVMIARAAGFTHAFTAETGLFNQRTDPFLIPRIAMEDTVVANRPPALNAPRTRLYLQALSRRVASC
jgi:peptidoglycan/xylan/chitin deacetylase (PgdA/CDA1 family)